MKLDQEILAELLKKKGIGPEGSKSLKREELIQLNTLFKSSTASLTTKATLLTALLTLSPTGDELEWITALKNNPESILPSELLGYINFTDNHFLQLIKKVINHEELTIEESRICMEYVLTKEAPEYLKASFLEAERLKRESFTENKCFFDYLYLKSKRETIQTFPIIDICDSYDGSNRSHNFSPFVAALLASVGFPTLIHGIESVAPKEGFTSHQILKQAGKNPFISIHQAAKNLSSHEIAWAYIDQSVFFPELFELRQMRKEMVKRPFLATFEKLLQPIRSTKGNYIITGYTHAHYKQEVVNQLQTQGKCAKAIVAKGVEGSTHMSLSKNTVAMIYDGNSIKEFTFNPSDVQLEALEQKQDKNLTAYDSYQEGVNALNGVKNYAKENILYSASIILKHLNLLEEIEIKNRLINSLDSGNALRHWERGNAN